MNENIDKNNENIEEKANTRLQGKVKQSSLEYISAMEGTFAEKIQELITIHETKSEELVKLKTKDRIEQIDRAIQIIKNSIANVEIEANAFIEGYRNQVENRIADIVDKVVEQDQLKQQYIELQDRADELEVENNNNKIEIVELKANIKLLEQANTELVNKNNEILNSEIEAKNRVEQITNSKNAEIDKLRADNDSKAIAINTLEKNNLILEQIKIGLEDRTEQLKADTEAKNNIIDKLQEELRQVNIEAKNSTEKLIEAMRELAEARSIINTNIDEIDKLKIDNISLKGQLENKIKQIEKMQKVETKKTTK